ncbi:MAG: hypothetical protein VR70_17410 [Rhodospirillaceae bacterium BRH_c57]|nr:MAG: hypothetical protein VR70_17410 [Rhodospirillaceae bacterium BRH_c57]
MVRQSLDAEMRHWALLAVGALALGGLMALSLALLRTPVVQDLLPAGYFRMALVVHVVFTVVLWYLAVLGLMATWAASGLAEDGVAVRGPAVGALAVRGAALSLPVMAVPVMAGWGVPILNNYVPVGAHPAFFAGLVLFLVCIALPVGRLLASMPRPMEGASFGVAAAGIIYLVALWCFLLAWRQLPPGLEDEPHYEALFWGGGHILQFVNTALMLVAWQVVGERLHAVPPLPQVWFRRVLALLVTVAFGGPVLYLLLEAGDARLVTGFTELYRYGLIVQPAVMMVALAWALVRRGVPCGRPAGAGLVLSLLLFAVGGVLGYFMGQGDTRTTGHYHAVIGGVTLAFMVFVIEVVLPRLGRPLAGRRWPLACIWAYGVGQLLHAVGLWLAGTGGVARKTAGADQALSSPLEVGAMVVMGGGAVLAVFGGVTFVVLALGKLAPSKPLLEL